MTINYFSNFPKIKYFNVLSTNITLRAAFIEKLKLNASVYYPYVIREGETPDGIATWYYGNPGYDWLIFLTNNIIDPHSQWPKTYSQFEKYIIKKYGTIDSAKSKIEFYRKNPDVSYINIDGSGFTTSPSNSGERTLTNEDIRITAESYALINDQINYYPVYSYDYEVELNEQKRNISLIDNKFKNVITTELGTLLNG